MFFQQLINGVVLGSIYALTSMGATLVYGILGILDISNAGAYTIGAYSAFLMYTLTGNAILSFLVAVLLTGLFGVLVQKLLYMPLMKEQPLVPLIASIGLFIFIQEFIRLIAGPQIKEYNIPVAFSGINTEKLVVSGVWILILILTFVFLLFLWMLLNKSRAGLAWKATALDQDIATAMGINSKKVVASNFLLGYGFAAAAGIMVAILYHSIFPTMGDVPAYKMLAIIVLGGLGNPLGTVVAGLIIGLSETYAAVYIGSFFPKDAIAFIVLIVIILIKPNGLLGEKISN
ncbi:amino acid/amide ABC transporter membrane protein 1, HAAT family (TC 3.A.1.4.-) [Dethiosulfatibacter aminovorans DSM 17477]|uniref:Amino acid/amide ABC transporter membrane protein 1, HAAT family (TC 3.A.1.4.-) n=1 Tax=Dethiosulfatibacter aminovorans DSM 17477 TaxID=1121476 RepID=A0A1M6E4E0_9FIRM|nr:branched-chain amino acid ABC transporter permease [Dethiosulfatibacter aminovorans]SHI80357.1 amino acid/amide ABC transporter membrane protein 1, HAAT family (TC 3.A.1.4.-) [Dethiosulfatibacter aminovorans DSM 17477]